MKASLRPGLSTTKRIVVDRGRTISFMGEEARVYATPQLVLDIEDTCRRFLLEHSDPGEDSVGAEICIKHQAPTLLDMAVEITVRVAAVEGRRIHFDVSAEDAIEQVSSGTHARFVVDVAKTKERLRAKAAKRTGQTRAT